MTFFFLPRRSPHCKTMKKMEMDDRPPPGLAWGISSRVPTGEDRSLVLVLSDFHTREEVDLFEPFAALVRHPEKDPGLSSVPPVL